MQKNRQSFLYVALFVSLPRTFRSGRDHETVNVCLVNSTHASRMAAAARVIFNPVRLGVSNLHSPPRRDQSYHTRNLCGNVPAHILTQRNKKQQ